METAQFNRKILSRSQSTSPDTVTGDGIGTEGSTDENEEFSEFDDDEEEAAVEGDKEVWNEFARSFSKVQTVLERNRDLIQQVNQNHQSRNPVNMARNVSLIQELNGNIARVASIYSDLSTNFTGAVLHQRQQPDNVPTDRSSDGGRGSLRI